VDLVHGLWITSGLGPRWTAVVRPRARRAGAMAHRRSPRGVEEGEGDMVVSGVPSLETEWRRRGWVTAAKWWRLKARGGGELRRERGGKEGGVGCGEVRHDRGTFYRCRGGGRRPVDGEVKAAPLMAVRASHRKRGRRRRPIKEG
jgi:hypothetical protein